MLSVSLKSIRLTAPHGLYPQEHILGNDFEVDVDIYLPDSQPWPYADYTLIQSTVAEVFHKEGQLLETFVYNIHSALKASFPVSLKVKVAVRKLHPPMPGEVAHAQVCYEQ